jgi:hypothetical protein
LDSVHDRLEDEQRRESANSTAIYNGAQHVSYYRKRTVTYRVTEV